ncbi:MAG: hypothetical protein R3F38_03790 [Gammaproteobacteria bacterium]
MAVIASVGGVFCCMVLVLAFFAVLTSFPDSRFHGGTHRARHHSAGNDSACLRHPYLFWLWLLAIPVKISLALKPYRPDEIFPGRIVCWWNNILPYRTSRS